MEADTADFHMTLFFHEGCQPCKLHGWHPSWKKSVSPASALLSWRQPAKDANRLRVGGVLLRSPGAPSDSGMQRVLFCHLRGQKCNLLAPAGNSENWADMLSWHGSTKQEHPKEGHHGPSAQQLFEQSPGRRQGAPETRKPSKKMCPKTQAVLGCTSSANAIPRRQRHIPGRCLPRAR